MVIGDKPIGGMTTDNFLRTLKAIVDKEVSPLQQRITALEVENRAMRSRLNSRGQGGQSSGGYQPLRRSR